MILGRSVTPLDIERTDGLTENNIFHGEFPRLRASLCIPRRASRRSERL